MSSIPQVLLSPGDHPMPLISLGTASFPPADSETVKLAVLEAIKIGYRHFDTAFAYRSEPPLGEAIAEALRLGLIKSRDELFITTKLWSSFAERDLVVPAIQMSLKNLQLDFVDLYLIHLPVRLSQEVRQMPAPKEYVHPLDIKSVWEGMEECHKLGLAKSIGISNFTCRMIDEVLAIAKITPSVNQVEMNPLWQQKQLREFCKEKGVHITAYSPLGANGTKWGDNRIVECNELKEIAKARGKTIAQVSLRWVYEQGVSIVFKTFNNERMKENLQIFDWSLSEEESNKISQLSQRKGFRISDSVGPHDFVVAIDNEI